MDIIVIDRFVHLASNRIYEANTLLSIEDKQALQSFSVAELDTMYSYVMDLPSSEIANVIQNVEYQVE